MVGEYFEINTSEMAENALNQSSVVSAMLYGVADKQLERIPIKAEISRGYPISMESLIGILHLRFFKVTKPRQPLPRVNKILKAPTILQQRHWVYSFDTDPLLQKQKFCFGSYYTKQKHLSFFLRNVENIGEYSRKYKNTGEYQRNLEIYLQYRRCRKYRR